MSYQASTFTPTFVYDSKLRLKKTNWACNTVYRRALHLSHYFTNSISSVRRTDIFLISPKFGSLCFKKTRLIDSKF